jgi:hypothetical protein
VQILYILPFALLSLTLVGTCLAVPRWRRYVIAAVVGPIAFAVCAIVGMGATVLSAKPLGFDQVLGFNEEWDPGSPRGIAVLLMIFVLPGTIGATVATMIANWIQRWALRRLGFQIDR